MPFSPRWGCVRVWSDDDAAGYGRWGFEDEFAIKRHDGENLLPSPRSHVAFRAESADAVRGFHSAAIANGAIDEGAPDFCPEYGDNYFAAFVMDFDGNRLEAKADVRGI